MNGEHGEDLVLALRDFLDHVAILIDMLGFNCHVFDVRIDLVCELLAHIEHLALHDLASVNFLLALVLLLPKLHGFAFQHLRLSLLLLGLLGEDVFNLAANLLNLGIELCLLI